MSAEFMMLSHGIAGNIQNHKSMLRRQVVRGLIDDALSYYYENRKKIDEELSLEENDLRAKARTW